MGRRAKRMAEGETPITGVAMSASARARRAPGQPPRAATRKRSATGRPAPAAPAPVEAAPRVTIFVSHKKTTHGQLARRIKHLFESRTERLDVLICEEDIAVGDLWEEWIERGLSQSQILLVLWPPREAAADTTWLVAEIERFRALCPDGRLVVIKCPDDPFPGLFRNVQMVDACRTALAERLLQPLYCTSKLTSVTPPLNERVTASEIARDAEEVELGFLGLAVTESRSLCEGLIVETAGLDVEQALDAANVLAPNGCRDILAWEKPSFSFGELHARASQEKGKGTFWIEEMARVIRDVTRQSSGSIMTSTFRGRGEAAGKIFRPQLESVDLVGSTPVRFHFCFHEVLVPELVRGPGPIGVVFNLLHLANRVRWEVLHPFLIKLGIGRGAVGAELSPQERRELIAKVNTSLRVIDLEADRHRMLDEALTGFDEVDRERIDQMRKERDRIRQAIASAADSNDFAKLMEELTRALEFNCKAMEVLAARFLELAQEDSQQLRAKLERGRAAAPQGSAAGGP